MSLAGDVAHVLDALAEADVPHMLVGAFAPDAHGVPRASLDVDLQVSMEAFPAGSTGLGLIIEERTHEPVFGQEVLIGHPPLSATPFELFRTSHWFTREALERRVSAAVPILQRETPVPTVTDFVLLKACHMVAPSRPRRKAAQDAVDLEQVMGAHRDDVDLERLESIGTRLGCWEAVRAIWADLEPEA